MDEALRAQAFAALYLRTRAPMLRWCQRKVGRWEAEDLWHDAIIAAWRHWRTGEPVAHPESWLRGILWHVWQTRQRRFGQRRQSGAAVRNWYVHDRCLHQDTRHLEIREALLNLPDPSRRTALAVGMGETPQDVARQQRTTVKAQWVRIQRVRQRLAQ
jgi:DNA-directed RNA polymerase specialized sigma24 family protein